jgi:hypothetical protein
MHGGGRAYAAHQEANRMGKFDDFQFESSTCHCSYDTDKQVNLQVYLFI